MNFRTAIMFFFAMVLTSPGHAAFAQQREQESSFKAVIHKLASLGDRSTGSTGSLMAAEYIKDEFNQIGLTSVGTQVFSLPVLRHTQSQLLLPDKNRTVDLPPALLNAISPQTIPKEGTVGPLVYVGAGNLADFNGKQIEGAIVLMDIDSGKNWLNAASLGAKALIYVDHNATSRMQFEDKLELSPLHFPRFRLLVSKLRELFGSFEESPQGIVEPEVRLTSNTTWQEVQAENIYGMIEGSDPQLKEELVVVEAFYDSAAFVSGLSPGADEACSIATMFDLARLLIRYPPGRSVLFVATAGHAQTLAGMREMIWSISARSKDQRKIEKDLKKTASQFQESLSFLQAIKEKGAGALADPELIATDNFESRFLEAISDRLKTEVDRISRRLMRLRLVQSESQDRDLIAQLIEQRTTLRRIGWRTTLSDLSPEETAALLKLISPAIDDHERILADTRKELTSVKSSRRFRGIAKSLDIAAVVSLHLSSHGDGFGAFNYGWLHKFRARVNRTPNYSTLDDVLRSGAEKLEQDASQSVLYRDTLRPSRLRSWQSYFLDKPPLGGEISALAGYIGFTFVTVHDARARWGTPTDTPVHVNWSFAVSQSRQITQMIRHLTVAPRLHNDSFPRKGFTSVAGRARFLRHGELFPDQPAPGTVIMAFQGAGRYYSFVNSLGSFNLKGVSTKKMVRDKVIIEGYKFDPHTGATVWAIDKPLTGKSAYRLKIVRSNVETNLIIFGCRQTTLFNLLEPRNFHYMTRIQLIDGRREAKPVHYWWSRIDTRSSVIASMYMEPGSRMKLTLSDTVLRKKMILTNASEEKPTGKGFLVDDHPFIYRTDYQVARDMWHLLKPRINNLERHGIYNERISQLRNEGLAALTEADQALQDKRYVRFTEAATRSWALASRVYNDVENTQKDVLFGVLFYIALFVPFAFCMERLIFSFTDIHKRIIAFCVILVLLIAVIYYVHPAFQLAYSPMVVILAFFIMGLSFIVTLIIYFRFEEEMNKLQRRARQMKAAEIGRWKAFVAAFLLGVSNLRRRRMRTALTCTTLIILTFTVMSFTSVKSMRHHSRLLFQDQSAYQGYMFKNANWDDMPHEALNVISNHFEDRGTAAARVWLEDQDRTRTLRVPIQYENRRFDANGIVGLSAEEAQVTGIDRILIGGRWFTPEDRQSVILSERMAASLGITPDRLQNVTVKMWGMPFVVVGVFSGKALMDRTDLDGEPLTPVTFPSEVSVEMTEVEMEALESGEDVRSFQSRYQHIDGELVAILPDRTLLSAGGTLKSVAVRPTAAAVDAEQAGDLVDRFGLMLFSGETTGTFLYYAADTMSYSGVPNVVIPVIISIFIVLNTMIGSVYERKREIGIYTSVGLAPSHVSFLFIAEALAFAVLSVVLGYLLAQITASLFAGTSLWAGITVNYSSLAGVAAMVLVILVVLVSVIYPSKVAGEIAIPDVNRSWKLPAEVGNRLELTLPFLMSYKEHLSIGGFLWEHFDGHKDVSHGLFSAGEMSLTRAQCQIGIAPSVPAGEKKEPECAAGDQPEFLQIMAHVWLAPFDFGIMQNVTVAFCMAADDESSLEIRVRLDRLSGEANAWRRINKAFLHELRKQLLIWRSLDEENKGQYERLIIQEAQKQAIDLVVEQV